MPEVLGTTIFVTETTVTISFNAKFFDCLGTLKYSRSGSKNWSLGSTKIIGDRFHGIRQMPSPVYYASLLGLSLTVSGLLGEGAASSSCQVPSSLSSMVNMRGGEYWTALQAASAGGHKAIVHLLLDKGADVNAQGGYYGTALHVAAAEGHKGIAQLFLDRGANVNEQSGVYGTALHAASAEGHKGIVQLLLDRGANIHEHGGDYGTALQAASAKGHIDNRGAAS